MGISRQINFQGGFDAGWFGPLPQLVKIAMAAYLNILAFQREHRALSADAHALASEAYLRFLTMLKDTAAGTSSDAEK